MSTTMVFRKTNLHTGRHLAVTPENSATRHLSYGRIILNKDVPTVSFSNPGQETGLIVLSGSATIASEGQRVELQKFDAVYLPLGAQVEVTSDAADIAEFSAGVTERHPMQVVRYQDVSRDSTLNFKVGSEGQQRSVSILLGKNVQANRLLLGFTVSDPGNWTSWPPHEHAKMLEEMYVYFDMPAPAFGLQLVYNNTEYPELVTPVRDGDAVLMPSGYHPNVSVPGHRITFLWALAAHREKEDRQYGVVNIQPAFDTKRT
jgi:5-deoxy-glucuronate isomerase